MKILITGDMGFIGTALKAELTKTSIKHEGYDIQRNSQEDICNKLELDKKFETGQYDLVIHLAALAGVRRSEEFPEEYIETNIRGTSHIINACEKYKVKLIFFSSSSVLGGCLSAKQYEPIPLRETDRYNPRGLYAVTKVAGEMMIKMSSIDAVIVRPFTVYGENGRPDMVIYKWINQIKSGNVITVFGDGKTARGYTYVGDLVKGVIDIINNFDTCKNKTIHLGGSEVINLEEILQLFKSHLKSRKIKVTTVNLGLPKADVIYSLADTAVAYNLIGWKPEKRFAEVIRRILKKEI